MRRSLKNHDLINQLLRLLRAGSLQRADRLLDLLHPADIADFLGQLRPAEAQTLIELLFSQRRAGKTLSELPSDLIPDFLKLVDNDRLAQILLRSEPDDAITFLSSIEGERREKILEKIDIKKRQELDRLLKYPLGTAGNLMTPRFLALSKGQTAQEAIDVIRTMGNKIEAIFYLYVVDDDQHLLGVVPIRRLVSSPADRALERLMIVDPVYVLDFDPQEYVSQIVSKYNLLALPVLDSEKRLIGIITVDDVIDVLQEEATEDMYKLVGLDQEDRVFSPLKTSVSKRLPWMSVNLLTAFLDALVVGMFDATIQQKVVLAAFMPVVAGMGGNMGTQTLTVITRGIALGEFEFARAFNVIFKNMAIGASIGAVTGILCALLASFWKGEPLLGLVLFLSMTGNLAIAGLMGSTVPILLKKFNQDPALGGSVILTTFTDVCGFAIFLGLAKLVFHL